MAFRAGVSFGCCFIASLLDWKGYWLATKAISKCFVMRLVKYAQKKDLTPPIRAYRPVPAFEGADP